MKISIITVSFNSSLTIRDTIESVVAQSFTNIEYIIIDGGSNDGTLSIINEYKDKITKVVSEPDYGIYDAMNKGINAATGDIVGMLNSDDFFENNDVLSNVANAFSLDSSADIVFGDIVFVRPDNLNKIVRYYSSVRFRVWKLRFGWMPPHPATFVRRSVYDAYGLYNLQYSIAADFEIFVRWLLVHRLNYLRMNRVLVRMRIGGLSTSGLRSSLFLNREIAKACKSNGIYTNIIFLLSKFPVKLLELIRRPNGNPPPLKNSQGQK